jgi:predicted DNA-binding transcriptional regulator YafY
MNRIDRLFGILILLQSKKYVPAERIAERFGISLRTVYRDVKALGEQGVPISFEPHQGYFIVSGYFLPPVSFTSEEANALLLMQAMVYGFADKSVQTHYCSALTKVKNVLKAGQKEKLEQLTSQIKLQIPACFQLNSDYLSTLQHAISTKVVVELAYKNNKEEVSARQVEPIGLVFYALNWHLIAWCHLRKDYRDFRVSRILRIRSTDLPFKKADHMPLGDYMKLLPVDY